MYLLYLILKRSVTKVFDLFISFLQFLAAKTDNDIDDTLVDIIAEQKEIICDYLLEWLNQLRHSPEIVNHSKES